MRRWQWRSLALLTVWLMLFLSLPGQAQIRVSLKLYGGYSYLQGGEGNEGSKGFTDYWKTQVHVYGGYDYTAEYQPFHYGLDAGGELIIYFSPVVGIGFGSGYIEAKRTTTIDLTKPGESALISMKPKAQAIPIRASLYLSVPLGGYANLTFHGGAGYYLAKFTSVLRIEEGSDWLQYEQEAKGKDIGFHGGLGLEINLTPHFGLFVEGLARYAKIGKFEGTFTSSMTGHSESESGKLYYFKETASGLGTFPIVLVLEEAPEGVDISDVREAKIDFSGFTARAGIILRF